MSSVMPQYIIFALQASVTCAADTLHHLSTFQQGGKHFFKKTCRSMFLQDWEVFHCVHYYYYLLAVCENRWRSFVPALEPCRSQRTGSVYCAPKKAITMLMCHSRRVNPDVKGWWGERSHSGLTAKQCLGSISYQTHNMEVQRRGEERKG